MGIMLGNLSVKDIEARLGVTFSSEDVAALQETRQENVSIPLESGKWHCYDIPLMFMTATKEDAVKFVGIFEKYTAPMRGSFQIGFLH